MFEDDGSPKSPVDQTDMGGGEIGAVLRDCHSVAVAVDDASNAFAAVVDEDDKGGFEPIEVHGMVRSRDMVDRVRHGFVDTPQVLGSVAVVVSEDVNRRDAVARGDMPRMTLNCLLVVDPDDHQAWNHQIRHRAEIAVGGGGDVNVTTTTTVRMQWRMKWTPLLLDGVLKSCFLEKEELSGPLCEDNWKRKRKMNENVCRPRAVLSGTGE